jgi:calcium-dependent protein kinase
MGCCFKPSKPHPDTSGSLPLPLQSHRQVLYPLQKNIREAYNFKQIIGHGHYGTVRLAIHKVRTTEQVAVKTVLKKKLKRERESFEKEIDILGSLDHPNIIKLYCVYEDEKAYHLVTEYCSGGELFDSIVEKGHYMESDAARLMNKIFLAVNHLHVNSIVHRDLKPENFIFESKESSAELKLIDFGLSNKFFDKFHSMEMHSMVGTPSYIAPEVLKGSYSFKCDIWSSGVIMYVMLCGSLPFTGSSTNEVLEKILRGEVAFNEELWERISREAKDLLGHLLVLDPKKRFTAEQALGHPWFQNSPRHLLKIDPVILNSLRKYKAKTQFQSEVYSIIVKHLNLVQIQSLKEAFLALDTEKNGFLSFEEVEEGLKRAGFNPAGQEIANIIRNADVKGDGRINYTEFIAATLDFRAALDDEAMRNAFQLFDIDNSGFITAEELKEALASSGRYFLDGQIAAILREIGTPEGISYENFRKIISQAGV